MRSRKLAVLLAGTTLLGVTSLSGVAVAESTGSAGTAGAAGAAGVSGVSRAAEPAAAAAGADSRALGELRALVANGVPGADPVLDTRLRRALVTADKALASVRGNAGATPRADIPPMAGLKLDALLEAVKSLDIGAALASLTTLLDGVLATLTGTAPTATSSVPDVPDVQLPEIPDVQIPEVQVPEIQVPEVKVPEMPEIRMPAFSLPDIRFSGIGTSAFRMSDVPRRQLTSMPPAFRKMPGFRAGR